MQDKTVRRRDFLKAAVGTTIATALRPQGPADFVFRNGKIITVDRGSTVADSIAISGDRVVAVGPSAAMAAFTAPATRTIDLRGKTVIPGLIDGHAHMDREGLKNVFPSLGRVRSIRDITADMTMVGGKIVHQIPNWPAQ
ncbi:MAG TPA: amidohydrolase family protein [Terriglobia bacterium]|nr:amidohydrolase family protein [Terriglobia bacterium]